MGEGAASISTVIGAFTSAAGTMATDIFTGLGQILPVVLPILAALIIVGVLIRVIQRVTGRRV